MLRLKRYFLPSLTSNNIVNADPPKWLAIAILGIILLLATLFRLEGLDERTMSHIEIYVPNIELPSYEMSDPPARLTLRNTITGTMFEPHPPAWYIFMWFWTKLLGTDIYIIRFPSVLFGVASVFLIYILGTLTVTRLTGLLGATLLAFNGYHIYWSQIARPYITGCFLGLLSTVLLLLVFHKVRRKNILVFLYLLITLCGLLTMHYFWILFAVHIIWNLSNGWMDESKKMGLLKSQLFIFILASPLVTIAIFQSKKSYLGTDVLFYLKEFFQFGFLFNPEKINATIQNPLPNILMFILPIIALFLLLVGLIDKRKQPHETDISDITGPSLKQLALLTAFVIIFILFVTNKAHGYAPSKTNKMLLSSSVPLMVFMLALLLQRYAPCIYKTKVLLTQKRLLTEGPLILISLLIFLPVIIISGITMFIPFFASRHMHIFVPYLLIVLSYGTVKICYRYVRRFSSILFLTITIFLIVIHLSSISYHKHRPSSPRDYKGLAQQWIPNITATDLIFIQKSWITTPIFYYLKESQYNYVGKDYSKAAMMNPESRVWILSSPHLLPNKVKEMKDALIGYVKLTSIHALRIQADLYSRQNVDNRTVSRSTD
jgi:4-amino-4-deoxy-L-arabinose transferase-like glycosyltransferase